LNDVHQFIDMVQGVMRAKAASSTPTPHCTRCHTPLDHPNPQASSAPLAPEALAQLFLKLIQAASTLPDSAEVAESVKLDAPGDAKRSASIGQQKSNATLLLSEIKNYST
jgi:hypothetical protein